MRLALAVGCATLVAGCLDINPPLPKTGLCGLAGEYAARPWPPADVAVGIVAVEVADVNADEIDDLVFLNAPEGAPPEQNGFFILLGPEKPKLEYHAFVPTVSTPFAMEVFQFTGDACLDVSVFGTAGGAGVIEIWENIGPLGMFPAEPATTRQVEFEPQLGEVGFIEVGRLSAGAVNDLAVASGPNLVVIEIADDLVAELPGAPSTPVNRVGDPLADWTAVKGVRFEPSQPDPSFDDLLILERTNATWLENTDGAGDFGDLEVENSEDTFDLETLQIIDLDGNDSPDIIGGGANDFGAYVIDRFETDANIGTREWVGGSIAGVTALDSIVVGDLGGAAAPEIVVIDRDIDNGSTAHLINDAAQLNGNQLIPGEETPFDFTGIDPGFGALLDFDNDGVDDVWVIDPATGAIECLAVSNQELVPCE